VYLAAQAGNAVLIYMFQMHNLNDFGWLQRIKKMNSTIGGSLKFSLKTAILLLVNLNCVFVGCVVIKASTIIL
jgi:hypothetical protein